MWDYADGMELLRIFWDVAMANNSDAKRYDEGSAFPVGAAGGLERALTAASFTEVRHTAIDVPTTFADFDDLWAPMLGAQGPAPAYVATLEAAARTRLRAALHERLGDGPIELTARAWAAAGSSPS